MGQYYLLANLDKKEFIYPSDIRGFANLFEWCVNRQSGILCFLLAKSSDREGNSGRWAGDRVVLIGDYDVSGLYYEALRNFKNIARKVVKDYNEFIGDKDFKLGLGFEKCEGCGMKILPTDIWKKHNTCFKKEVETWEFQSVNGL